MTVTLGHARTRRWVSTVEDLAARYRRLLGSQAYLLTLLASALFCGFGIACSIAARQYLEFFGTHADGSADLLLDKLPVLGMEQFLVWGTPLFICMLGVLSLCFPERLPFILKSYGLLYGIRGFFVILTPLGVRADQLIAHPSNFFQAMTYGSSDFFFSGHVSAPFMMAMLFWHKPLIRNFMFLASFIFAAAVLLAHTHYSIDVFAIPLIVPSIERIARWLFPQDAALADQR